MYVTITTHFYISTLLLLSTKKSVSYLKPREFDAEISAALVKRLNLNVIFLISNIPSTIKSDLISNPYFLSVAIF